MTRRRTLALGAGAAIGLRSGLAKAIQTRPVIVELFTSQGCSSCPPADALLGEIKSMPGVIGLSINVDYWDYLGWRDTLADKSHSQRQYDYARSRGDMDVYTPQIIIDGGAHYVGSNRSVVLSAIESARNSAGAAMVDMSFDEDSEWLSVSLGSRAEAPKSTIWVLSVTPKAKVRIEKGENTGRSIEYHNVVRSIVPAGVWDGKPARFNLSKTALLAPDCTACVALLQEGSLGPVLAAATWGSFEA